MINQPIYKLVRLNGIITLSPLMLAVMSLHPDDNTNYLNV